MSTESLLLHGDALEQLKALEDNSIDSLVTDPPAGISFMAKAWDDDKGGRKQWIEWMSSVMKEAMRVLKPGAHGLVWAIPRTSHWTATALEDAGFEVRDVVTHLFGTGFPKSMDISKAIDKQAGVEREVLGKHPTINGKGKKWCGKPGEPHYALRDEKIGAVLTAPATDAAKQWQGWGTALKPASEHWILVRKPITEKTVAANVIKFGTGGINIDASRIAHNEAPKMMKAQTDKDSMTGSGKYGQAGRHKDVLELKPNGRFPANLILSHNPDCVEVGSKKVGNGKSGMVEFSQPDIRGNNFNQTGKKQKQLGMSYGTETVAAFECTPDCAVAALDEQSGILKSGAFKQKGLSSHSSQPSGWNTGNRIEKDFGPANEGGASRFFKTLDGCTEGCPVAALDEQSGNVGANGGNSCGYDWTKSGVNMGKKIVTDNKGGASRFFYCAKTSKSERNAGCEAIGTKEKQGDRPNSKDATGKFPDHDHRPSGGNNHPTVKPKKLMSYLIKMITPPGGLVLDPFAGSGSTGVAAIENGFQFLGIEKEDDYATIAESRIQHALNSVLK